MGAGRQSPAHGELKGWAGCSLPRSQDSVPLRNGKSTSALAGDRSARAVRGARREQEAGQGRLVEGGSEGRPIPLSPGLWESRGPVGVGPSTPLAGCPRGTGVWAQLGRTGPACRKMPRRLVTGAQRGGGTKRGVRDTRGRCGCPRGEFLVLAAPAPAGGCAQAGACRGTSRYAGSGCIP